jgi:hypothetical protein
LDPQKLPERTMHDRQDRCQKICPDAGDNYPE